MSNNKYKNKIFRMVVKNTTNELFVPDPLFGNIHIFDITTGILIRQIQYCPKKAHMWSGNYGIKLSKDERTLIVANPYQACIYMYNTTNGEPIDKIIINVSIYQLEIYEDKIYVNNTGSFTNGACLHVIDTDIDDNSNKIINEFNVSDEICVNIGIYENEIYVTSRTFNTIFVFDMNGKYLHEMPLKFENHSTCSKYLNPKNTIRNLMIVAIENDKMFVLESNSNLLILH